MHTELTSDNERQMEKFKFKIKIEKIKSENLFKIEVDANNEIVGIQRRDLSLRLK